MQRGGAAPARERPARRQPGRDLSLGLHAANRGARARPRASDSSRGPSPGERSRPRFSTWNHSSRSKTVAEREPLRHTHRLEQGRAYVQVPLSDLERGPPGANTHRGECAHDLQRRRAEQDHRHEAQSARHVPLSTAPSSDRGASPLGLRRPEDEHVESAVGASDFPRISEDGASLLGTTGR